MEFNHFPFQTVPYHGDGENHRIPESRFTPCSTLHGHLCRPHDGRYEKAGTRYETNEMLNVPLYTVEGAIIIPKPRP